MTGVVLTFAAALTATILCVAAFLRGDGLTAVVTGALAILAACACWAMMDEAETVQGSARLPEVRADRANYWREWGG